MFLLYTNSESAPDPENDIATFDQHQTIDMAIRKARPAITLTEEQFHAISRALADPRRFAIFQRIFATRGMTCSALREQHEITPATVSHHLKELTEAGLIEVQREGRLANLFPCRPFWRAYVKRLSGI